MGATSVLSVTTNTAQIEISGMANNVDTGYTFRVSVYQGSTHIKDNTWSGTTATTYTTYTVTGLNPDTNYTFNGYATSPSSGIEYAEGSASSYTSMPTPSTPGNLTATSSADGKSISTSWSSSSYASGYNIQWKESGTSSWSSNSISGTSYNITGLKGGTQYEIQVRAYYTGHQGDTFSSWNTAYCTTINARPSNFSWTTAKTSGSSFNLTASEWNSFTNSINQFLTYTGHSNYTFDVANSGSNFTAAMFNQAQGNIALMSPPTAPPAQVSSGQKVYASYLNNIVSSLNSVQ